MKNGLCSVCGKNPATITCGSCGRLTCANVHCGEVPPPTRQNNTWICGRCSGVASRAGVKMPDLPELPPDYIPRAKRRVILESPYGGDDVEAVIINVRYASACIKDSLSRGETPLAGHVLYAQNGVLDGRDQAEVEQGIDAALGWAECAEGTVVYTDRGVTREMRLGIDHARACERNIETRKLGGDWGLCWYPIGRKTPRDDGGKCPDDAIGGCELPVGHEGDHE